MKRMSTGRPATYTNYLENAYIFFGEDSPAVAYLRYQIQMNGADTEVPYDEKRMVNYLCDLNVKGWNDGDE